MTDLGGARILVAGGGVFGSAVALGLARAGAEVILADPAPLGANASGVAAGMLAPAFEAALDFSAAGRFPLLKAARDCWPEFIGDLPGVTLDRSGARFDGDPSQVEAVLARLTAEGAAAERRGRGLFSDDDWRVDPLVVLSAMRARLKALGGRVVGTSAEALMDQADSTVLACGFGGLALAPELAVLSPIKGQILRFAPGVLEAGLVRRGPTGYVAPSPGGALAGATMDEGLNDTLIDPAATSRLRAVALALAPELAAVDFKAAAGVRAATPDGLPLVGRSARDRVFLAAGARRNGWLLAPLVARILVDQIGGGQTNAWAAAFEAGRFSRPG